MKTLLAVIVSLLVIQPALAQSGSVRSFLNQRCVSCHDGEDAEAGFHIKRLPLEPHDPNNLARWVKILDRVQDEQMPPPEEEQPTAPERVKFVNALRQALLKAFTLSSHLVSLGFQLSV